MHPESPSDPDTQFATHGGLPLAYTIEGQGDRTIVAVPGLPGSIRDFRWLAPTLDTEFRIIRIELPGFGGSLRNGHRGMSIEERASCVLSLVQELQLGPIMLLGHSSGGTVIAHLACHHPELVEHCIFLAANGPRSHYPVRAYRALAKVFDRKLGRKAMQPILRRLYGAMGFPAHLTDDERMFTTLDAAMTDFALHAENLRGLRCPSMVAWAEDDNLIPARVFEGLEEIAPAGPRLRFAKGGHNIQKTQANEIAAAIHELVDQ